MIPWEELGRATVPGQDSELVLRQRGQEFSIRTAGTELMNSRIYGSEQALATLVFEQTGQRPGMRVLVGGLGMGYTLAQTLALSLPDTRVRVAELIPEVIAWNRDVFGHLSGMPLNDPRVRVKAADVVRVIQKKQRAWDAILLDIDNGPAGLTRTSNNRLYSDPGLKAIFKALVPGGVIGIWSAGEDPAFTRRLGKCGFRAKAVAVRATSSGKGSRHCIWVAVKPERLSA